MSIHIVCDNCGSLESQKWRSYTDVVRNKKGELVEAEFHFCSLECFKKFVEDLKEDEKKTKAKI
jgi:hypothetical protein